MMSVIAELERRRMLGAHGHPMDEATSPLADPSSWEAQWTYEATPFMDYAQAAVDRRSEEYRKIYGDNLPAGLRWSVNKVMRAS